MIPVSGPIDTIEAVEQMWMMLRSNADPSIDDRQPDSAVVRLHPQCDAALVGMPDGVGGEVQQDLAGAFGVAYDRRLRPVPLDGYVLVGRHGQGDLFDLLHHVRDVERPDVEGELAVLTPGDEQHVFRQPGGVLHFANNRGKGVPHVIVRARFHQRPLCLGTEMRQRCAQFMAGVCRESLQRPMRLFDPIEHPVDRLGHDGYFGLAGGTRQPPAQIAGPDLSGLRSGGLQRGQGAGDRQPRTAPGDEPDDWEEKKSHASDERQGDEIGNTAGGDEDVVRPGLPVLDPVAPCLALGDGIENQ